MPNYCNESTLVKELSTEYDRITGISSMRVVSQMMKSTKFVMLYLLLASLLCQIAINKMIFSTFNSSKERSLHNDQGNNDSELASCATTRMSGEKKQTSNDQADAVQESSTQSSNDSTSENKQHSRGTESQGTDQDRGNEQGGQHQGNSQRQNEDGGDEFNGNQDSQDKQQDDDEPDESDELDDEEQSTESNEGQEETATIEDGQHEKDDNPQQSQDKADTAKLLDLLDEPLIVKGITVYFPAFREKKFTSHPQRGTSFRGSIPEMQKPRKSKHLSKEGPSSPTGSFSVDQLLPEKTETRFKKVYMKKCKQQQAGRINSRQNSAVSTEPYQVNLFDRKFYYNKDGTENLYDGPKEIAAKLGLEYKGSPIVTVYPSSTTVEQPSKALSMPQSPSPAKNDHVMSENSRPKKSGTPSTLTLAAYKEELRNKALKRNQS